MEVTWEDVSSSSSDSSTINDMVVENGSAVQSTVDNTDDSLEQWPVVRLRKRRNSAPEVLEDDGSEWVKRYSVVAVAPVVSLLVNGMDSHNWSTRTSRSFSVCLPQRSIDASADWADVTEPLPIITGGPSRAGLERVNTQLTDWVDQLKDGDIHPFPRTAARDSENSLQSNEAAESASPQSPMYVDFVETDDDSAIDPTDVSHLNQPTSLTQDVSSPTTSDTQRRTVSWSGTIQEFIDPNEGPLAFFEQRMSSSQLDTDPGSASRHWSQMSNMSMVHFREHRDSIELYRDKDGKLRRSTFGSLKSRRSGQFRRSRPLVDNRQSKGSVNVREEDEEDEEDE